MTIEDLPAILASHAMWIRGEEGGNRANLHGANLHSADLRGADLLDLQTPVTVSPAFCGPGLVTARTVNGEQMYDVTLADGRTLVNVPERFVTRTTRAIK